MKVELYVPRPEDIAWWETHLRILKDGGRIGMTDGSYVINKKTKVVTLAGPKDPWDNPRTLLMHDRHRRVLAHLNWHVAPDVHKSFENFETDYVSWDTDTFTPEEWDKVKKHYLEEGS